MQKAQAQVTEGVRSADGPHRKATAVVTGVVVPAAAVPAARTANGRARARAAEQIYN
jgi:hypothetical protein